MNLIDQLGPQYVNEWFVGALFKVDDTVHMLDRVRDGLVYTWTLKPDSTVWNTDRTTLPFDNFTSFEDFAYPRLGYRNFDMPLGNGKEVNTVRFAQSQRSVHRGLRRDSLDWFDYPLANGVMPSAYLQGRDVKEVQALFFPKFIPYTEGIKKLMRGEVIAFAISEDLAVGLSSTSASAAADIHFRQKVVGNVDSDGKIILFNKTLRRTHFKKLMEANNAGM